MCPRTAKVVPRKKLQSDKKSITAISLHFSPDMVALATTVEPTPQPMSVHINQRVPLGHYILLITCSFALLFGSFNL
jgi:hypothetical protein